MYFVAKPIVTNGLVLNMDAGNTLSYTSGSSTWRDLSGNNFTGSLVNSPVFTPSNGGALTFNGSNNYVNLDNPSSLNVLNYTVCVWARSFTFSNFQNIIFKGVSNGQYGIAFNSSGDWTPQPNLSSFTGDLISLNTWNYFTITYNGSQLTAYRNAIQRMQYTISVVSEGTSITIGADTVNNRYFNGNISITQIYNRALTPSEIQQNFNTLRGRYGL